MHLVAARAERLVPGGFAERLTRDGEYLGGGAGALRQRHGLDVGVPRSFDRVHAEIGPVHLPLGLELRQHVALASLRRFGIASRRQPGRRLRNPREQRRLRKRELAGVLLEVISRRFLDPVATVTEVHVVEVEVQNLVFAQLAFEPPREDELADLTRNRPFGSQQHELYDLLRDRAAALRSPTLHDVAAHRSQNAVVVEPLVLVEVCVFGCQHGQHHVAGHLRHRDDGSPFREDLADHLLVSVVHACRLWRPVVAKTGHRGQVATEIRVGAENDERTRDERPAEKLRPNRALTASALLARASLALPLFGPLPCHLVRRRL